MRRLKVFGLCSPSFGHPDEQNIMYPVETFKIFSGAMNVEWSEVKMSSSSYRQFQFREKKASLH